MYAGFFLALYAVAHIGLRAGLPDADPWLLPLAALLTAIGLTEIYRLDPMLARDQSVWIVVGLIGFLALILLVARRAPAGGLQVHAGRGRGGAAGADDGGRHHVNGAQLWIRVGGVQVQPGEFSKLLLVLFLAGYLREKREVLAMSHRRVLGIGLPAARHLGAAADDDRHRPVWWP